MLPEFVAACGFAVAKAAGYEADDFLAAAVATEERRGGTAIVASGDRDAFQLASQRTTILQPVRAGEMARIGPAEVRERYGVEPGQVPDFIALRGDPSDKLPGARGVGADGRGEPAAEATAPGEGARRRPLPGGGGGAARSTADRDDGRRRRRCRRCATQKPTWAKAAALAKEWSLNRLAERLDQLAR